MASTKAYADDDALSVNMDSTQTAPLEYEKTRLMNSHEYSRPSSTTAPSQRSNCVIFLLTASNAITIVILFILVIRIHPKTTESHYSTLVTYPDRPKWFPPQSL